MRLLFILMSYIPCCHIVLGSVAMTQVTKATIRKDIKQLTQTAVVAFPKNIVFKNDTKKKLADTLKTGDKVTIKLGYNSRLNTEFEGYIARIEQTIPIRIHCEDQMFTLKRATVEPQVWESATLGEIIDYVAPNVQAEIVDRTINLGAFSVDRVSPATVFKYLQDNYNLSIFFKNNVLVVGFPYAFEPQAQIWVYDFQKNVPKDGNDLEYQTVDTYKIVVKAVSNLKTGKKLIVWLPYKGAEGDIRTLNFPEMSEAELKKQAQAELDRFTYDGYRGRVNGFGFPVVQFTEVVRLRDNQFKDREANYFVDATEIEFDESTFRRSCTIGKRASR